MSIKQYICVYIFSLSVLIGGAYNTYYHFDFSHSSDSKSYMQMAKGNYNVNITHRYRFVVPLLAGTLAQAIDNFYSSIWKNRGGFDWSLRLSFFIVNTLLMSLVGMVIFTICSASGASFTGCLVGLLAFLTSRWAFYISGLPYIDSLYLLSICGLMLGLIKNNQWLIASAIVIGPLAKESFWLFLPMIVIFNYKNIFKTLLFLTVGAIFFYFSRQVIDALAGSIYTDGLTNAVNHLENIFYTFGRITSIKGLGEILFVFGIFNLLLWYTKWSIHISFWFLFITVLAHVFLSGDVGRMLYLSAPLFCTLFSIGFDELYKKISL